jgi:hypothetical protein
MPLMTNILQHAPTDANPQEGANPTFNYSHKIGWFQDVLSPSQLAVFNAVRDCGTLNKMGEHVAVVGVRAIIRETGLCRSAVKDAKRVLRSLRILEVVERENPWTRTAQTLKIRNYKSIKTDWNQRGWTHYIKNRGRQICNKFGELIALELPKLPELVKRAVNQLMKQVYKLALPSIPDPEAEIAWNYIADGLKANLARQTFETWIAPVKGWQLRGRTLFVAAPSPEFMHLGAKYANEIKAAIGQLPIDQVEFVNRPPPT